MLLAKYRRLRRVLAGAAIAFIGLCLFLVADGWQAFGKRVDGERATRVHASPQWRDGAFQNPQPMWIDTWGSMTAIFSSSDFVAPAGVPPDVVDVVRTDPKLFATPPASGLRVTWLGHSTQLIEIDGARVLTDPIFGERASPYTWVGPRRWYPPPLPLDDVPAVDVVLLSHDHHDHLQHETIAQMVDWPVTFVVPLGVGSHLVYWGVPAERVIELDWWQTTTVTTKTGASLELACTPARHASGRHMFDQMATLWASWALLGPTHRAWFSGDTGLFPGLADIGAKYGPFDVTMIEAGQYGSAWPDWHLGPEQAVQAHDMVRGKVLMPVHWGLWVLAMHGWTEPVERIVVEAAQRHVVVAVPRPGESIEPAALTEATPQRWWPTLPWQTAAEAPIKATGMPP
jgi:L-ascorbate metabolism protein UlaG (beta-lactamase superfamily)